MREKRKGPISRAGGLVDSVAATVRRMQRDREPRVLAYDLTGYARLIQPEARGHERILEIGEEMVALAAAEPRESGRAAQTASGAGRKAPTAGAEAGAKATRAGAKSNRAGAKTAGPGPRAIGPGRRAIGRGPRAGEAAPRAPEARPHSHGKPKRAAPKEDT